MLVSEDEFAKSDPVLMRSNIAMDLIANIVSLWINQVMLDSDININQKTASSSFLYLKTLILYLVNQHLVLVNQYGGFKNTVSPESIFRVEEGVKTSLDDFVNDKLSIKHTNNHHALGFYTDMVLLRVNLLLEEDISRWSRSILSGVVQSHHSLENFKEALDLN